MTLGILEGKIAVEIGAGAAVGIGGATAMRMAREGATVIVADLNIAGATAIAERIHEQGGQAHPVAVDIASEVSVQSLFAEIAERYGRLDVMHVNATDTKIRERDGNALETDLEVYDQSLAVGLRGHLLCTRGALPMMLANGGGAIVYTSSDSSMTGQPDRHLAYGIAKAGVNALMRHVAATWGPQNVRANAVSPGLVLTETVLRDHSEESRERFRAMTRSTRLGKPEDIAALITFLSSDDAEWINGQVYSINGGMLMR